MNYITPELLAKGRSNDPITLTAAEVEWDEVAQRYRDYIDSVKPAFPPGLRRLVESYYLHGAVIQAAGSRLGRFLFVLRLDPPPHSLLTFSYDLVESAHINKEALPETLRSSGAIIEWEYDEIERLAGETTTWRQSVLLSNGWEIDLHFRDVSIEETQPVLQPALFSVPVAHLQPT